MFVSKRKFEALQAELQGAYATIASLSEQHRQQPSSLNDKLQQLWANRPVWDEADECDG